MNYLPQSNATLTEVLSETTVEDWDHVETDGPAIWTGAQDCYVDQSMRTVYDASAGDLKHVQDLKLYLPNGWAEDQGFHWTSGLDVLITFGDLSHRHRIMEVNAPVMPDEGPISWIPGHPVTLHLDPSPIEV